MKAGNIILAVIILPLMSNVLLTGYTDEGNKDKNSSGTGTYATTNTLKHKPLILIIKELASPTAPLIVSVYSPNNTFPDPHGQLKEYKFYPKSTTLIAKITDLSYGKFALALYQDLNNNGKIDRDLLGIPTEPYAFSNNYHPSTHAPSFADCSFDYNSRANSLTINMIRSSVF